MSSTDDQAPRRTREHPEKGEPSHTSPAPHPRPLIRRRGGSRGGGRVAARLTKEMATMTANMRNITQQNLAMQEMLANMQWQGYHAPPYTAPDDILLEAQGYYQEEEVQSQSAKTPYTGMEAPQEREAEMETSIDYAPERPYGAPFDHLPSHEPKGRPHRAGSVFDRIGSEAPRNRQDLSPPAPRNRQAYFHPDRGWRPDPPYHEGQPACSDESLASPPRNRRERRSQARKEAATSPPRPEPLRVEDEDSDEPQRSCDLDDDDEQSPFSEAIRNAPMLNHFTLPKIPKYDGRGDPAKHINNYKTHESERGHSGNEVQSFSPNVKWRCRSLVHKAT